MVFYDGKEDFPEYQEMKLSDAFLGENDEEIALQLIVKLYNINSERNSEILRKCDILRQYSIFVERVRECQDTGKLTNSKMIEIITSCISEMRVVPKVRRRLRLYQHETLRMQEYLQRLLLRIPV